MALRRLDQRRVGKWKSGLCSTRGIASLGEARISERVQRYDEQSCQKRHG